MMLAWALASWLTAQGGGQAPALQPDVAGSVTTWAEVDTNARRVASGELGGDDDDKITPPPAAPVEQPIADGLMRAEGTLVASHVENGLALRSDNALGLKLFATQASERMLVGQARLSLVTTRVPGDIVLIMQGFGKFRAQRSGARTYAYGRSDVIIEKGLPSLFGIDLTLRSGISGIGFNAFDNALFTSAGGGAMVGLRASAGPERVDVFVDGSARAYPFALADPDNGAADQRSDATGAFVLQLTSARKIYLSGGYVVVGNVSNAQGESFVRHRLSALVGFRLPAQVTCTAQAALQLTQYVDGVSIGQSYFLGLDDETQNVFDVTLSRPLIGGIFLQARASFYGNELAADGVRFSRQTAALGLRADL